MRSLMALTVAAIWSVVIGYGTYTRPPAPLACSSAQFGGFGGQGFGFSGRRGNPFDADYGAFMQISKTTGDTVHRAQDADQLNTALGQAARRLHDRPQAHRHRLVVRGRRRPAHRSRGSALAVVEPHQADARPGEHRGSLPPGC
jgi:hypothetical protein